MKSTGMQKNTSVACAVQKTKVRAVKGEVVEACSTKVVVEGKELRLLVAQVLK
jgi:hypothetical protein